MQQLVFWNNNKYTEKLISVFSNENVITSYTELGVVTKQLDKYKSAIVLCELKWLSSGSTSMQNLQGIELVKELRTKYNLNIPVLFVSFLPLNNIFSADREIITSIGHNFCQLPDSVEQFINHLKIENSLSPTELKDIQLFSCNPDGIIRAKLHQLSSLPQKLKTENPDYVKKELEKCIDEMHSVYKVPSDLSLSIFKNEFTSLNEDNINRALRFVDEIAKDLTEKYSVDRNETINILGKKKPWNLLLLDDELDKDYELIKELNRRGVEVICTTNAKDAMNTLVKDDSLRAKIPLILTDYRLYDNSGDVQKQQRVQGYSFLQEIGQRFQSKLISAIVYSGMPRQFLLETFKTFRIRTEIYSKNDFKLEDAASRNFLASRIIEIGDENYDAMLALPLGSDGWEHNLHKTYLLYRSQKDYEKRERDLCDYCTDWVEKFRSGDNPATPMIKGDAFKPLIKDTETQTLERFEAYFKTRRLAQYLKLYYEKHSIEDATRKIVKQLAPANKNIEKSVSIRGYFSQVLCVKLEEFPFAATIEELCWFEYDLKIHVLQGYKKFRNKFDETENLIGTFISDKTKLVETLRLNNFTHKNNRKQELFFNKKSYNPFLFDKMDLGICLEWLDLLKEYFTESDVLEYLNLLLKLKETWN